MSAAKLCLGLGTETIFAAKLQMGLQPRALTEAQMAFRIGTQAVFSPNLRPCLKTCPLTAQLGFGLGSKPVFA
ncbi:hypothetical protein D3C81_1777210 [compost metagenome]